MGKQVLFYLFIVLLSIPAILPLFMPGFFTMHDDTQIARVIQMTKAFVDGQFPVRWVADLGYGYGYPLFNFYGPLPYYFGMGGMLLGLSPLGATKLMFVVGIVGAAISMYLLAREIWGTLPAVLSAVLYQYAPYHAVDIYVRGAVAEFWAIAILPLLFLGLVKLDKKKVPSGNYVREYFSIFLIISISYAALIITHNITAMITTILLVIFGLIAGGFILCNFLKNQKINLGVSKKLTIACVSLLAGLGISAFFWLPAFAETAYTNVDSVIGAGADYKDHFISLNQLWDSTWGFGGSAKGEADGLSFKVGKVHIVLAVFSLILFLWQIYSNTAKRRLIVYILSIVGIILISVLMTQEISRQIWSMLPILAFIQYPWRFLVVIIFGVSLLAGGLFTVKRDYFVVSLSLLMLFVVIYINQKYFVPQYYVRNEPSVYVSDEYVKWQASHMSDEYMPKGFVKPFVWNDIVKNKIIVDASITVQSEVYKTHQYEIKYSSPENTTIHINTAYFPGWEASVEGSPVQLDVKQNGMGVQLPGGTHTLVMLRKSTLLERTADTISLFCFAAVFGTMMRLRYLSYGQKTQR